MVTRYPFVWGDSALRAAFPVTIAPEATNRVMKITRIPTLDGWRGIAILLVLIEHAQKGLFNRVYGGHDWLSLGAHGVTLFFVLSGYLITSRLLDEERIDLGAFYIRRFFRLMPTAFVYLAFIWLFSWVSGVRYIGSGDTISCLLFFRNYYPDAAHSTPFNTFTVHFWSLSVEEQFYLTWPPLLLWVGRKRALPIAVLGIAGCALFRIEHWYWSTGIEANIDKLLVGSVLAILMVETNLRAWLVKFNRILLPACLVSFVFFIRNFHYVIPLSESIFIGLAIASTSVKPHSIFARLLDTKLLSQIGVLSYSLYVWQEFFIVPHWASIGLLLLPLVAVGNWALIEKPLIARGKRIIYARRLPAFGA
jgi:peptidoglycan/LPS O-acetylase OafA/YrhL